MGYCGGHSKKPRNGSPRKRGILAASEREPKVSFALGGVHPRGEDVKMAARAMTVLHQEARSPRDIESMRTLAGVLRCRALRTMGLRARQIRSAVRTRRPRRDIVHAFARFSLFSTLLGSPLAHAEFPGWQGMRVIHQEGRPSIMRTGDIDADGRDELFVVNGRASRLDIYEWLPEDKRGDQELATKDDPNKLPLASDLRHEELQLEHVPRDILIEDLDGDGQLEMVILVSPPLQVVVYRRDAAGEWLKHYSIDLMDGDVSSKGDSLLFREMAPGDNQLLVSLNNGIQQVELKSGGRAEWMTPREERGRTHWWFADLDADGDQDLVEQTREADESVRWYRCLENGTLGPAAVLLDRSASDVEVLQTKNSAQLVVLDGSVRGLLRRYDLDAGEPSPFGQQRPLALPEGKKLPWCGMLQGADRALVMADPTRPQLLSYTLDESGWQTQHAFPAMTDIGALATLAAKPGTLLIWSKEASDLLVSRWESGRLSYPEPWQQSAEVEDRKILALETVGATTWWVQRVGKDLDFYRSTADQQQPRRVRFAGVGAKAETVAWIGGDRLLMKEQHARELKLIVHEDAKATTSSPMHLKKATLAEFKMVAIGDQFQLAKVTDGVLQWIGDDLQSHEQVMLPQSQELADYIAKDSSSGWALQRDAQFMHQIKIEPSGLSQAVAKHKIPAGSALIDDPVLGLMLLGRDRVTHLSPGRPWELKLRDVVDKRAARSGGIREIKFHRIDAVDIDGDNYEDLILFDDIKHRITVLSDQDGTLKPKISWPVFDDLIYPYGDETDNRVKEPRALMAADMDGDGQQDLAILSQDRLLVYLARKK